MGIDWTAYDIEGCGPLWRWATGAIDYPTPHGPPGRMFLLAAVGALSPRVLIADAIRLLQPKLQVRENVRMQRGSGWVVVSQSTGGIFGGATFLVWTHRITGPLGGNYTYGLGIHGHGATIQALLAALRNHTPIVSGA